MIQPQREDPQWEKPTLADTPVKDEENVIKDNDNDACNDDDEKQPSPWERAFQFLVLPVAAYGLWWLVVIIAPRYPAGLGPTVAGGRPER